MKTTSHRNVSIHRDLRRSTRQDPGRRHVTTILPLILVQIINVALHLKAFPVDIIKPVIRLHLGITGKTMSFYRNTTSRSQDWLCAQKKLISLGIILTKAEEMLKEEEAVEADNTWCVGTVKWRRPNSSEDKQQNKSMDAELMINGLLAFRAFFLSQLVAEQIWFKSFAQTYTQVVEEPGCKVFRVFPSLKDESSGQWESHEM